MDIHSTHQLFKNLNNDELSFAYSGSFSDTITHKIIELTHFNIDSSKNFNKLKNKISFLMAECYQNVVRHGKTTDTPEDQYIKTSAFFARSLSDTFSIASANLIPNSTISSIKEKLDRANSLSPEELKTLQREVLSKGKLSEKGGAGLGIIEMARKTGQKIAYDFLNYDDNSSIFYLQLKLRSQQEGSLECNDVSLDEIKSLHALMMKKDILIIHKGDFSEHSVLPVIQMIEKNLRKSDEIQQGKQRLYNVSVEMLQNISMHAIRRNGVNEGLFVLGKKDDRYFIGSMNYIQPSKSKPFIERLDKLKALTKEELNELYRKKLSMIVNQKVGVTGIGLVYIFRKCNNLDYSIISQNDMSLFSIVATI